MRLCEGIFASNRPNGGLYQIPVSRGGTHSHESDPGSSPGDWYRGAPRFRIGGAIDRRHGSRASSTRRAPTEHCPAQPIAGQASGPANGRSRDSHRCRSGVAVAASSGRGPDWFRWDVFVVDPVQARCHPEVGRVRSVERGCPQVDADLPYRRCMSGSGHSASASSPTSDTNASASRPSSNGYILSSRCPPQPPSRGRCRRAGRFRLAP